jgi:molybdopterin converting factor small subunit
MEMPNGATVGDLTAEVVRRYPTMTQDASRLLVAVNDELQDHNFALREGDETALIPPVSGGAIP